jgi:hypothetical protein
MASMPSANFFFSPQPTPVSAIERDAVHHAVEQQQALAPFVSTWQGRRPRMSLSAVSRASLMLTTTPAGW